MNNYEEYRPKIKSGDIVAFNNEGIVTFFTTSNYSHVGVVWKVGKRLFVIEAVEPKVRIMPLSTLAKDGCYIIHTKIAPSQAEIEFLLSKVGVADYSKLDCIKAYFKKLDIGKDNSFQCAELTITSRKLSGLDLGNVATPDAVVQAALDMGLSINYVKG